jgi:hypothetical protein
MADSPGKSRDTKTIYRWWIAAVLAAATLFIAVVISLVPDHRMDGTDCRRECRHHIVQLGTSLLNYANSHAGMLPPAYVADKNGKPINSWRVLLFRQLDRPDLFAAYDYGEPWDGPHNSKLTVDYFPYNFWCPSVSERPTGLTNYLVVTGPGTLFPGDKQVNLKDVKDGLKNTILLVEVADSDINWMEPRDLTFDEALQGINATIDGKRGKGMSISSFHFAGVNVVLADGHTRLLTEDTSPALLKALLTINGGEDLKALGWK